MFSTGTLLCCALPIILVSAGLGGAVAFLAAEFPVLIALSEYKSWLFISSALILILTTWLLWRSGAACPADPEKAATCRRLQTVSKNLLVLTAIIWSVGLFFAYLILPLQVWLEG